MKFKVLALIYFCVSYSFAQEIKYKNTIKINLASPLTKIYTFQYERQLNDHFSFNTTVFYRNKTSIPFGVPLDTLAKKHGLGLTGIKFHYIYINEAKIGTKGISPEIRYYFGSGKNRFFLSAFGQYELYDMNVPADIVVPIFGRNADVKLPIDFTFQSFSGGLMFGKRFNWNRVSLDVVIFGPHFGFANNFSAVGSNAYLKNLSADDIAVVKQKIAERFGLSDKYFALTVTNDQASIKSIRNIPYLGVRGFGFNLGYSF